MYCGLTTKLTCSVLSAVSSALPSRQRRLEAFVESQELVRSNDIYERAEPLLQRLWSHGRDRGEGAFRLAEVSRRFGPALPPRRACGRSLQLRTKFYHVLLHR